MRTAALDYWQVKQAFAALLELPLDERSAELQRLEEAQPALAQALRARLQRMDEVDTTEAANKAPTVAGYRVLQAIGAGGMGQVWRVQRLDRPQQQLALKQLLADPQDGLLQRRFELERRVLERLNHPLIVPLIDAGIDHAGRPYLVTPWVDGERIDRWCMQHNCSVAQRVRLVADLAGALSHAHAQLIVHCDLKPANVLVDRSGQVRVLDFGIARLLDGSHTASADLSLMTLRYAAPEQVSAAAIGPGCDLYALGVLLYELLTGQSPYPDCSNPAALTQAIAQFDPVAPSRRSGSATTALQDRIDPDLDAIVLKLLRKQPADRYASAQELIDELLRWSSGEPVRARSDERGYLLRRRVHRHRWLLAGVLSLLLMLGWHVWRMDRELAATAWQRDRARAVADYFVQLFRSGTPGETRDGEVRALTLLDRSAARLADPQQEIPASTRALLQLVSGRVYADLGQVTQAQPLLAAALEQLRREQPPPIDELIDGYKTHAAVLYQLDQVPQSLAQSLAAIDLLQAHGEQDSERYAGMLQNAAIAYYTLGRHAEADAALQSALKVLEANQAQMRRAYILLLQILADMALAKNQTQQALDYLQRAERALPDLVPADVDLDLSLRRSLLAVQRDAGTDIQSQLQFWLPKARAHYGAGHIETAFWHELAAILALLARDFESARVQFELASSIATQLYAQPEHNYRLRFRRNLLLTRAAVAQQTGAADPGLLADAEALLERRLQLGFPDGTELKLESAMLVWLQCRNQPDAELKTRFNTRVSELLDEPRHKIWHQQLVRSWRCD